MSRQIPVKVVGGTWYSVDANRILCNDINLPGSPGYKIGPKPYLLTSLYGPMGVVWAKSEEDAIDVLVDADLGKAIEDDNGTATAGNDSRPVDLDNVGIGKVDLTQAHLLDLFRQAEAAGVDKLSDL